MSYLGAEPSSIPLINRGAAEVNNPGGAAPYKPGTMLQDFLNTLPGSSAPKPLIVQGGGVYNYPEIYGAPSGSYTPPVRARKDTQVLLLVAAAAGMWWALGVGGKGRSIW